MRTLVSNYLRQFAASATGWQERFNGNVDLTPIIDMVLARHAALAHERHIHVTLKNDGYGVVWGNATALEQVVTNLIKNAIIYTQKNGNGTVAVSLHPDYQGSIILKIKDNGIGIAGRDLAHVFEPFYRADTSRVRSVRSSGSGLGLAIVNEIVRMHHGKISIESARNQGTVVSVSLPVGVIHEIAPEIAKTHAEKNHVSIDFSGGLESLFPIFAHRPSLGGDKGDSQVHP
jgi:signal transduction histidine kinase